ncbi:MAG: hypothetical protein D8M58_03910 [Calditrichaeota bacterium]|nr:MAG: hypothetical protein DWQ03_03165 [Calditrichota bacterium]MBL1204513.1 hypothetical protein [Calditrichota bacterium]NOG44342.1 hypothetical protein [Calditrichota bacterium]
MNNLQTDNAPSSGVVIPPFMIGALSFFALSVLTILAETDLLGPYYNGRILAITHLAVLGWGTMIIFGALYQLIPVVFETALFSEKLAKTTTVIFSLSTALLVYSFWTDNYDSLLILASSLMFCSFSMFILNILLSKKNSKKNIQSRFISTSIYWLFLTVLFGLLISINFKYPFLAQVHLHYLKIHAHLGLVGWFILLIIGVSSTLIPMFLISHNLNKKKLDISFFLVNIGLASLALDWLFLNSKYLPYLYWFIISSGIFFYFSYIMESYKKRLRKELDVGMKYTVAAISLLLTPITVGLIILVDLNFEHDFLLRVTTLYGFTIIFGLISPLILGQTYKTLPFIIWLEKYKQYVGKYKTPMPKDLYSEKIGWLHLYTYFSSIITLVAGLLFNHYILINLGSYLFLITAVLYNINVFKIIFHKTKTEGL